MASLSPTGSASLLRRPVELLQTLIRFDTTNPPGREQECISYIGQLLTDAGFEISLLGRSPDRPNLVARLKGRGDSPPLLLHGHVDVVAAAEQDWEHPPFEGTIVDGYVWGRGALDMKGGIVMMLSALSRAKLEGLSLPGDVLLVLLSDEEAGSFNGARYLVENHPELFEGVRYAIGEFGGFSFPISGRRFYPIMVAEKHPCVLRAKVRGASGHGALAGRGSAVSRLAHLLHRLEQQPLPVHVTPVARQTFISVASTLPFPARMVFRQLVNPAMTARIIWLLGDRGKLFAPLFRNTANVTMIRGGDQINVIPSEVDIGLDCRLLPGYEPAHIIAELRDIIGGDVELDVVHHDPGPAEPDMGLFGALSAVLRQADPEGVPIPMLLPAATDGRFFSRLGIQSYGFLPMMLPPDFAFSETIHGANERVPVDALAFGAEVIYQLLQRFGEGGSGPRPPSPA